MELDFTRVWLPVIYLYGAGGIIIAAALFIVIKSGGLNLKKSSHRWWFGISICGYLYYLFLHLILTVFAVK